MMPDAEVLKVATEILSELPIGDFAIKLNHRCARRALAGVAQALSQHACAAPAGGGGGGGPPAPPPTGQNACNLLHPRPPPPPPPAPHPLPPSTRSGLLDAVLDIAGVPAAKFRPICSAIDKLDKEPWDAVRREMVEDKGLPPAVADAVGAMVQLRGEPRALLATLTAPGSAFAAHAGAAAALGELATLFRYLDAMGGALRHISFDLSLARGLDYYTGVIYEAVLTDPSYGVGSIAAGGRYDTLVGMFAAPGTTVPCVGVSIGVERVFAIMEANLARANGGALARTPPTVLVASIPSKRCDMTVARMGVCAELWAAGFAAEMVFAGDPKLQKQVAQAAEGGTPFMVVLGENELDEGKLQVKDMAAHTAVTVARGELVATLLALGAARVTAGVGAAGGGARRAAPAPAAAGAAAAGAAAGSGGGAGAVSAAGESEDGRQ